MHFKPLNTPHISLKSCLNTKLFTPIHLRYFSHLPIQQNLWTKNGINKMALQTKTWNSKLKNKPPISAIWEKEEEKTSSKKIISRWRKFHPLFSIILISFLSKNSLFAHLPNFFFSWFSSSEEHEQSTEKCTYKIRAFHFVHFFKKKFELRC